MRKVGRLIQRIHTETFHSVNKPTAAHDQRTYSARLICTNNDELQYAVSCKDAGTGFHPCELVHGAVGVVGKQTPSLCFVLDRTEFPDNTNGCCVATYVAKHG